MTTILTLASLIMIAHSAPTSPGAATAIKISAASTLADRAEKARETIEDKREIPADKKMRYRKCTRFEEDIRGMPDCVDFEYDFTEDWFYQANYRFKDQCRLRANITIATFGDIASIDARYQARYTVNLVGATLLRFTNNDKSIGLREDGEDEVHTLAWDNNEEILALLDPIWRECNGLGTHSY